MGWPYDTLIAKVYLPYFQNHGEASLRFLVDGKMSSQSFLAIYPTLPPLEELKEKEKKNMKKTVIEMFPEKISEELVTACKIVYTIGVVSQFVTEEIIPGSNLG